MKWIKGLFFGRELTDHLNETLTIRVQGVRFKIKKVDPLAYIEGTLVMRQHYGEHKPKKEASVTPDSIKQTRLHYRDVFLASIVYPKLARKLEDAKDGEIFVDYLMTDWELASELYAQITLYSHGKKKLRRGRSLNPGSLS